MFLRSVTSFGSVFFPDALEEGITKEGVVCPFPDPNFEGNVGTTTSNVVRREWEQGGLSPSYV